MDTVTIIGIGAFLALLLSGRALSERNMSSLRPGEKENLVESLARYRRIHLIPLLLIAAWFLAGSRFFGGANAIMQYVLYALLCAYVLGSNLFIYLKLRRRSLPEKFLRGYLLSRLLTFAGLVLLVLSLVFSGR